MDDRRESMRARHAAELEEKRRKLEEIRRRKAIVRDGASDAATGASASAAVPESVARAIGEQENRFDDFIQNILKSSTASVEPGDADATAGSAAAAAAPSAALSLAEKLAALSTVTNVAEIHIQPTLVETYTKHTETDITLEHEITVRDRPSEAMMEVDAVGSPQKQHRDAANSKNGAAATAAVTAAAGDATESGSGSGGGDVSMGLSEDEKKKIMQSESLEAFIMKASRVIERALTTSSKYDIMVDYGATVEDDRLPEDVAQTLKPLFTFKDDQWTRYRAVTDVDVSPFYPELLLVSYTARDFLEEEERELGASGARNAAGAASSSSSSSALLADLSRTTDGVVLLWSTALPTRPEYRFTCHSQVTSACFNPFDRNLIFGGTYSGQIVVWDTRAKSAPVQKTSLSSGSHTHPVYSLAVVGARSSYHLVSASTDGRVCIWDVDQLQQPLEMLDLRIAVSIVSNYSSVNIATDKKMEAAVTTFAIHRKENKQLYVGTEAGKLYATPLDAQKSKAAGAIADGVSMALDSDKTPRGLALSGFGSTSSAPAVGNVAAREIVVDAFSKEHAHFGPVTAMHLNPLLPVHRDGLLLTASLDSTVKLWSTEHPSSPLFSFEPSNDYVCDVRWSPLHPALFAVVDADGIISFWNICKDVEVPALEVKVGEKALNRLRWTTDGKSVIIGDASGNTIVYEVPAEIAMPLPDDLSQLESKVGSAILAVGMNRL
ncbi:hypothetical protein ATCC90586_007156 [Pythium insidiosum]|nr:hypothetical protein ATCC90586_007156 [Pythium insidiosum]